MRNSPVSIAEWLQQNGLTELVDSFLENHITIDVLPLLTEQDLIDLGVQSIGHRRRLLLSIQNLPSGDDLGSPGESHSTPFSDSGSPAESDQPREAITQTRRQLTVMFLDLVGSTTLSQQLDPEDYGDLIRDFRERCSNKILRYGGYIAQFMGDGILVYFGYPVAQENAAIHAITSAMEILSEVHGSTTGGHVITLRAGIATGFALADEQGEARISGDINVLGEVPNLAARIQDSAKPGTLLVSDATYSLAANAFEFNELEPAQLKGIAGLVRLRQVVSSSRLYEDELMDFHSDGSRFFGRSGELATLKEHWDAIDSVNTRVVTVCGEAGIGKSTLLREISQYITDSGYQVFSIKGSSLHINTAFHPLFAFVGKAMELHKIRDSNETRSLVCAYLEKIGITKPDVTESILRIADVTEPSDDKEQTIDPIEQRERTKNALLEFFIQFSSSDITTGNKFLLAIEDLHWWDASSLEVLPQLLSALNKPGFLVIVSYRPEFEETWINQIKHIKIKLDQLESAEIQQIVKSTANEVVLGNRVVDEIIKRSDGNPLFAEELTRSMTEMSRDATTLDNNQSIAAQQVPHSLQDSLMARLDRLSGFKEIAQISAIVGRAFSFEELLHVAEVCASRLLSALSRLAQAEVLISVVQDGVTQYRFTHALLHEAAYNSVPRRNRKLWHNRVAAYLEDQSPSARTNQPDLLAYHYFGAENRTTAIELWHAAGTQSMLQSANREAAGHFKTAFAAIETLESTESLKDPLIKEFATKMKVRVLADLGNVLTASEGYAANETGKAYQQAWDLIKHENDSVGKFSILYGLWNFNLVSAKTRAALKYADQFHAMAKSDHNSIALLAADCMLGQNLAMLGEFKDAHTYLQKAQSYGTTERRLQAVTDYGEEPTLTSMSFDAWMMWHFGLFQQAIDLSQQATQIAREVGHLNSTALALTFDGILNLLLRLPESALQRAEEVLVLTRDQDLAYWKAEAYIVKGKSLLELGDLHNGLSQMEKGLQAWKQTGALEHFVPSHMSFLAAGYLKSNRPNDALIMLDEAIGMVKRTDERWFLGELHRIRAESLIQLDHGSRQIESEYRRAVSVAVQQASIGQLIKTLNSFFLYSPEQAHDFFDELKNTNKPVDVSHEIEKHDVTILDALRETEDLIASFPDSSIFPDIIDARHLWIQSKPSS